MESIFPKKRGARSPEQPVCLCSMQHPGKDLLQLSLGPLIDDNSPLLAWGLFPSVGFCIVCLAGCSRGGFRLPRAAHGKGAGLWTQPCPKKRNPKLPLTFQQGCTASLAKAGALDSLSGSSSRSCVGARAATEDTVTVWGWLGMFSAGSHFSSVRCFQGCVELSQPSFLLLLLVEKVCASRN